MAAESKGRVTVTVMYQDENRGSVHINWTASTDLPAEVASRIQVATEYHLKELGLPEAASHAAAAAGPFAAIPLVPGVPSSHIRVTQYGDVVIYATSLFFG